MYLFYDSDSGTASISYTHECIFSTQLQYSRLNVGRWITYFSWFTVQIISFLIDYNYINVKELTNLIFRPQLQKGRRCRPCHHSLLRTD